MIYDFENERPGPLHLVKNPAIDSLVQLDDATGEPIKCAMCGEPFSIAWLCACDEPTDDDDDDEPEPIRSARDAARARRASIAAPLENSENAGQRWTAGEKLILAFCVTFLLYLLAQVVRVIL